MCAAAPCPGAPPPIQPQQGILLLRNGGVLRGKITRIGDRYIVAQGEGSELRLPASEVECPCSDLEDAYRVKRRGLPRGRAEAHLDLAQWCLGQRLLGDAAEQLLEARRLDPHHPLADLLERRLQMAAKSQRDPPPAPSPSNSPTDDQVDQAIARLSPGSVKTFTETIQPLLLNRCGAGGCHGGASGNPFSLRRPVWSGAITRRFTRHNLYAVLQQVNWLSPDSSPLVAAPAAPHGKTKTPVFGDHDARQYEQILGWVRRAASDQPNRELSTLAPPNVLLLQAQGPTPSDRKGPRRQPPSQPSGAAGGEAQPLRRGDPTEAAATAPGRSEPGTPDGGSPADPFDPEIFNRRFLPPTP